MASFDSQLWTLTQAKALSGNDKTVLNALASFAGHKGLFPSHESIASRSGLSVSTVIRSLKKAYRLGIVERTRQRQRIGGRIVNGPNRYSLILTALEQAKAAAKATTQMLREALYRRKQRLFSNCQNDSVYDSQSNYFKAPQHSMSDWLEISRRMDRGMTAEEAGYFTGMAQTS